MTTNCITEPRSSYASRLFTTGEVGWEGVRHIPGTMGQTKDYSELIKKAQVRCVRTCGVCVWGQHTTCAAQLWGLHGASGASSGWQAVAERSLAVPITPPFFPPLPSPVPRCRSCRALSGSLRSRRPSL